MLCLICCGFNVCCLRFHQPLQCIGGEWNLNEATSNGPLSSSCLCVLRCFSAQSDKSKITEDNKLSVVVFTTAQSLFYIPLCNEPFEDITVYYCTGQQTYDTQNVLPSCDFVPTKTMCPHNSIKPSKLNELLVHLLISTENQNNTIC